VQRKAAGKLSAKPKYHVKTDSGQVARAKVEKNVERQVKRT